jgi:hypothetical protein
LEVRFRGVEGVEELDESFNLQFKDFWEAIFKFASTSSPP